jgi:hypothetical protein
MALFVSHAVDEQPRLKLHGASTILLDCSRHTARVDCCG